MSQRPADDESPLSQPLAWLIEQTLRAPAAVLWGAGLVALLAILISVNHLEFKSSRLDLLNPDSRYNQRWLAYLEEFGERDDAVVVVRSGEPAKVTAAIDDLSGELAAQPQWFESIFYRRDLSRIKAKGLHLMPTSQLRSLAAQLQPSQAIAAGGSHSSATELTAGLARLEPQYLTAEEGRMGFVLLRLATPDDEFARGSAAIGKLHKLIASVRSRHDGVWFGLTGMPIIEYDEMRISQWDMVWTNVASLAGCMLLFVAGYGGLRHAAIAAVVLLVGMAWSFGFATLAVGHLNILSSAFGIVLIGLGIDFGIHYVACYLRLRGVGTQTHPALVQAAAEVGPGVVTSGLTIAAAFFMAGLTQFTGVRELGIIAGGGILLCVVAALVVLPPLVLLIDQRFPLKQVPTILPVAGWFAWIHRRPGLVLPLAAVATAAALFGVTRLWYDHNLLHLQPTHVESVDIERQIFAGNQDSVWFAVSMCDSRQELKRRKALFQKLPTVARAEDIASLIPEADPERQKLVAQIHDTLVRIVDAPRTASGPVVPASATRETLLPDALKAVLDMSDPTPPTTSDLPRELADRYIGRSGKHLLKVYARGDIWDMDRLRDFVADVESVDPQITGHPVQTFYASQHMQMSYVYAGIYALLAVFALILLDFRSLRYSLLAMLPLAMGFLQMCGLIGWFGIPLNAANLIALPLLLGIGVDDGVHLVHEMRRQQGRFRLNDSTAIAVILISTTTMASFSCLILARHQGLKSMGQVLTLGLVCCLSSSILVFPALLTWLTRKRPEGMAEEASAACREPTVAEPTEVSPIADDELQPGAIAAIAAAAEPEQSESPSPPIVPRRRAG